MKYIQFGIMAALIFGISMSPVISNGLAFADGHNTSCPAGFPKCRISDNVDPRAPIMVVPQASLNQCYQVDPLNPVVDPTLCDAQPPYVPAITDSG